MTVTVVREPLYRRAPEYRTSFGDLARRVGVELGLTPDDEQQDALDVMFAERAPGEPAARHACIVGPRQNIKSSTLQVAAATDMLVLGITGAVWTAHQSKTATKTWADLRGRLLASAEYAPLIGSLGGRGEERIYLLDDPNVSLEFRARSGGSGRGFTTSRLTLDEALFLRAADMGALLPTLLTRRDAQVRYASSGGFASSEVLRGLRQRARDGSDPRLFYAEYGAAHRDCAQRGCVHQLDAPGCALDDRELWWQACSALWSGRIDEENVADLRKALTPGEFAREVLVWWDEPPAGDGGALDVGRWMSLADPNAERGERVVFGVDVGEDRSAWVAVAWHRADGLVQVELTDSMLTAATLVSRLRGLLADWHSQVMVGGPAAAVESELPAVLVSAQEFAASCGRLVDLIEAGAIRHGNQLALNVAVEAAQWRRAGTAGELAFRLADAPLIGPLAAVVRALHGLTTTSGGGPSVW